MSKKTPKEAAEAIKAQLANIASLKSKSVKVGILSSGAGVYDDGQTVLDIGIAHEYGTDKIPRRSFLRTPLFVNQQKMSKFIDKQFDKVINQGFPAESALELIGVKAQSIIQESFTNKGFGTWSPLSASTIEKKGSSQILIDSGTLRNSITYQVK